MKQILRFIVLILFIHICIGCEKKPSDTEVQESGAEVAKTTTQVNTEQEERIKKAKEYDEYMQQRRAEIAAQEKLFQQNMPNHAISEDLDKGQIRSSYYEKIDGVSVAAPINVTDIVRDERYCTCKFKIKTFGGNELEYKATLKRDPFREEFENREVYHEKDYYEFNPDAYYLVEMELLTPIETKKITRSENNFLIGEMNEILDGEEREKLIKLFEQYENENYPYYFKANPEKSGGTLTVLDFVKVNLTGSPYDEYLVLFAKEKMKCFIVDNNTIIKDYYVSYPRVNPTILNGRLLVTSCFDDIVDYNQNGINEIYCIAGVYHDSMYFIEFDDESFNVKNIYSTFSMSGIDEIKYNKNETIIAITAGGFHFDAHAYVESIDQLVTSGIGDDVEVIMKYVDVYDEWVIIKLKHIENNNLRG